jgi:hypothetical protein
MDRPAVVETPTSAELGAEAVVRPLAENKAEILPAVAPLAREVDLLSPSPGFERVIPPAAAELGCRPTRECRKTIQ